MELFSVSSLTRRFAQKPDPHRRSTAVFCLVFGLSACTACSRQPSNPAHADPAVSSRVRGEPFAPDKLPYRLGWGNNTVVAEAVRDKDGPAGQQVRIVDAQGRTLQRLRSDRVNDVRVVQPLVSGEEGILITLSGGNSGLTDVYGFGRGGADRFLVSGASEVAVKDLDGDGTAEVTATYRLADIDGGGEHHGPLVTIVYQWDGTRFVEATKRFPEASRSRATEYQAQLVALEHKSAPPQGMRAASDNPDGHLDAVIGYLANAVFAGDGMVSRTWLNANIAPERQQAPANDVKEMNLELQSLQKPLSQHLDDTTDPHPTAPGTMAAPSPGTMAVPSAKTVDQPKQSSRATTPTRIVAGQACGHVHLGQSRREVQAILGKPSETRQIAGGLTEDIWNPTDDNSRTTDILSRQGAVVQIGVKSPNFATGTGLSTARPFRKALEEYAGLSMTACTYIAAEGGAYAEYFYDDKREGIAFGILTQDEEATSSGIFSTEPEAATKPDYIFVHRPGAAFLPPTFGARKLRTEVNSLLASSALYARLRQRSR